MEWKSIREGEFNHQCSVSYKGPCFSNLSQTQSVYTFILSTISLSDLKKQNAKNCAVIHKVRDAEVGNTSLILCRKECLALISFNFLIDFCAVLYQTMET